MKSVCSFVVKFASLISWSLACFDRVVFKGHLAQFASDSGSLKGFRRLQPLLCRSDEIRRLTLTLPLDEVPLLAR